MSGWVIVGDGAWGSALALHLRAGDHAVTLVGPAKKGSTPRGIPHVREAGGALADSERVILAMPIAVFAEGVEALAPHLRGDHRVLVTARGLCPQTRLRGSELVFSRTAARQVAALAGAATASAVREKEPVALVVGSAFPTWAAEVQEALSSAVVRIYTSRDLAGVELAGALATIMAVVMGAARAAAVGAATEATAMTRALAEMDRLVRGLGGRENTAYGLAGLGILATQVFAGAGEEMTVGAALVAGERVETLGVGELADTARTLAERARASDLRAPMVEAAAALLSGRIDAAQALAALMTRASRSEEG